MVDFEQTGGWRLEKEGTLSPSAHPPSGSELALSLCAVVLQRLDHVGWDERIEDDMVLDCRRLGNVVLTVLPDLRLSTPTVHKSSTSACSPSLIAVLHTGPLDYESLLSYEYLMINLQGISKSTCQTLCGEWPRC